MLIPATERLFRKIEGDTEWRETVEAAAGRGPVVYVLRNVSVIDYLALEHLTNRLDLPRIGYVNDLPTPLVPQKGTKGLEPAEQLRETVAAGQSAALFVKRPPNWTSTTHRGRSEGAALLESLLSLQAVRGEREIMMMPQTFVWTVRPERLGFSLVDTIFGPEDFPGDIRQAAQFLLNYRNGKLRAGEPLSLREFLERQGSDQPTPALLRQLTYALLRKVERERRTIVGPARKAPDRLREEVVQSPKLQKVIRELAGPGEGRVLLTDKARGMLKTMQTIPDPETARAFELVAETTLDHLFGGFDIDREGLARLRRVCGDGAVMLLPSHKSHVDYLLLSCLLYRNSIQLPVIAAGDNLSFFPAGPLLRRGGAFFIRRRVRGDRLYAAVLNAYLRRLVRDGHMIEFFLEGTRSRTGKVLPPKLGLLNMVVTAALALGNHKVYFQPVSIGYERLMEEGTYARELSGQKKQKENAFALLGISRVLTDRWGRVSVQFGEPFEVSELRDAAGFASHADVTPAGRRGIVKRLAHQVMHEINRVTAVTPGSLVGMVLLSHGRRGVGYRELVAHCRRLIKMVLRLGARATPSAVRRDSDELREGGIREVLKLYVKSGLVEQHVPGDTLTAEGRKRAALYTGTDVIFTVPDGKRIRLDLAKNPIIHWLVDRALIAVGLLCRPQPGEESPPDDGPAIEDDTLRTRVLALSRLFKYEFMYRVDAPFDEIFDDVVGDMVTCGELSIEEGRVGLGPGHDGLDGLAWVTFHATIIRNFIEGYRVAARSLGALLKGALDRKELLTRALRTGERMFLEGELERSEAVCRPVIDNALSSFCDQGYVLVNSEGGLELAESFRSEEAVKAIEMRVTAYVRRRTEDEPWA